MTTVGVMTTSGGCHFGLIGVAAGADDRGPYLPGTLTNELGPLQVRTMGCLDIGLVPFDRPAGGPRPTGSQLVDVHVANRCTHPEAFDLARAKVRGRGDDGTLRDVALSDPRREIVVLHVGGAERGLERVRLEGAEHLASLCFDLTLVAPDAPSSRPAPLCFARREVTWSAVTDPLALTRPPTRGGSRESSFAGWRESWFAVSRESSFAGWRESSFAGWRESAFDSSGGGT